MLHSPALKKGQKLFCAGLTLHEGVFLFCFFNQQRLRKCMFLCGLHVSERGSDTSYCSCCQCTHQVTSSGVKCSFWDLTWGGNSTTLLISDLTMVVYSQCQKFNECRSAEHPVEDLKYASFFFFFNHPNVLWHFPTCSGFSFARCFILFFFLSKIIPLISCWPFSRICRFIPFLLSGGRAGWTCRCVLSMTVAATRTAMLRTAGQRPAWTPRSPPWYAVHGHFHDISDLFGLDSLSLLLLDNRHPFKPP